MAKRHSAHHMRHKGPKQISAHARMVEKEEHEEHPHRMHHARKMHHKGHHSSHRRGYAPSEGFVTGHDEMVGRHDFAGLPRELVIKLYPASHMHPGGALDDTMSDIDSIQSGSGRDVNRHLSNQK